MKKIFLLLAVLTAFSFGASAQSYRNYGNYHRHNGYHDRALEYSFPHYLDGFNLYRGNRVESNLRVLFPMYFGLSTMFNNQSNSLESILGKNFYYSFELANLRFYSRRNHIETSLGLRFTFMDYALNDTAITFRKDSDGVYQPFPILNESTKYNGKKSKIHASYIGVPVKVAYRAGRGKVYLGASADYLLNGYTKYKRPAYRESTVDLFNRFRASAEAGFAYGILGVFANYGVTTLFPSNWDKAHSFTFGLTVMM